MDVVVGLLRILGIASVVLLVVGLMKPWPVLWWRAHQNRIGVLSLYGPLAALFWTGYFIFLRA